MARRARHSLPLPVRPAPAAAPAPGPSSGRWRWRDRLFPAGLFIAVFLAYQPAWRAGFIWDDDAHITPPGLRSLHGLGLIWFRPGAVQQWYPFLHTFSWLEYPLFGERPLGYHLVNLALHALDATLLWLVLRRLRVPGARLAAALFALHPVMVESVAWITELKNTLSGAFLLGAALAYLRFDAGRRARWWAAALGLFALALLSKSTAAVLPAALLVVFWWRRGRVAWRGDVRPLLPFFAVGAADGLFVAWVEWRLVGARGADFAFSLVERGLIASRAVWFYLGKLVWPADLVFMYPRWSIRADDPRLYAYPAALLLALAALWHWRRRARGPLAGALLFIGTLLPVLGFLNVYLFVFSFVADHLQYLACIGVFVPAAAGIAALRGRPGGRLVPALAVLLVAGLGVLTWRQSRMYRDAETLYRATLARNPAAWLAHGNLGGLLLRQGKYGEAVAELEAARRAHPEKTELQFNLGLAELRLHRPELALPLFAGLAAARPDDAESQRYAGDALLQLGELPQALPHYEAALRVRPDFTAVEINLGNVLLALGRTSEGIDLLTRVLGREPDNTAARFNLGVALAGLGRVTEAEAQFAAVLRVDPADASAHLSLGMLLLDAGRSREAIPHLEAAQRLDPGLAGTPDALAAARRAAAGTPPAQ